MNEGSIYINPHSNVQNIFEDILNSEEQEYPIYICDVNDLIAKFKLWKKVFPRIEPYYAVKCNNHPIVIQVLATLGVNFDCASKFEIEQIISLKVDPSRIIFAHICKSASHIKYASENNVKLMTFDCEEELFKIKNNFPEAETILRIKYDDSNAESNFGIKFGCDPYTEAEELLKISFRENLKVVGVSFHIGFLSKNPSLFYKTIQAAYHVFQIAAKLGHKFYLLDIGGGVLGTDDNLAALYAEYINKGLNDYFSDDSIRIISEPGTFFVQSAFTLACCVQLVKKKVTKNVQTDKSIYYNYYINDGVHGDFAVIMYHDIKYIPRPIKNTNETLFLSTIWGPTCDVADKVCDQVLLPKMDIGDWLLFNNTGNYTQVLSSKFNGFGSKKFIT